MQTPTRRTVLKATAVALAAPMINRGTFQAFAASPKHYPARVMALLERSLVIDMLAPLTMSATSTISTRRLTDAEAAEFRSSGMTAMHNSAGYRSITAYSDILGYLARWNAFVGRNDDLFLIVNNAEDIKRAKATQKIAIIQGLQNSEHFRDVEDVQRFYELGQRCSQLTYNWQTTIGSGSTERVDGGVSDFGVGIIKKMNDVGMLIDVSHCGDKTTLDAIELASGPIAVTHSNCRALNDHPRLKTDEAIRALAAKGGVMGITGVRMFVRNKEPTTIEHIVDHIDHVVRLVGIEHVGIGSDSDLHGYDDLPAAQLEQMKSSAKSSYGFRDKHDIDGFDHPEKMFDLVEALVRRGYSDDHIELILGRNFFRLFESVWK